MSEVESTELLTGDGSDGLEEFAADIADQIQSFVLAVTEVAKAESPDQAVSLLLLEVSQLMLAGGRLGAIVDVVPDDRFEPDAGADPDVDALRIRLAELLEPIDVYTEVFDPFGPLESAEAEQFRLSDDLAAIVNDLIHGVAHYQAGRWAEALWWWQFSYLSHWGTQAGAALRALHAVVAHVRLDSDEVDEDVAPVSV